ncbi:MAG TPA: glycine/sarcosine/betaine reductase selenoprotein B family protein [Dehalococcoidia bacterium]|nr:glycine/sarcosine/betaine reductase selenoprotein B family protein [Dehalococcoidia bacterium]
MPKLDRLPEVNRNALLTFPAPVNDGAPCSPLAKPLSACRVALVTTAGLHMRGDVAFVSGDQSYRVIPSATPGGEILQSHSSIGFDHVPFQRDMNVTFPVDRLRELADRGTIGSLATNFYSFMGAQRGWDRIQSETAPAVAKALLADGVDAVFLTPT